MSFWSANLNVLRQISPRYAQWVETAPEDPSLTVVHSPSGQPNLRIQSAQGPTQLVYRHDDPLADERNRVRGMDLKLGRGTFLFGFGLGYRTMVLFQSCPEGHVVLVCEENPALVRLGLTHLDLAGPLAAGRLVFVPADSEFLEDAAGPMIRQYVRGEIGVMIDERCRPFFSDDFRNRAERFSHRVRQAALSETAYLENAGKIVENEIVNLPLTLLSPPVNGLKDALAGVPAVVVSAGPSLADNVHLLSEAVGRAAVIATAPTLRVLSAYDLWPDLVGTLDFTPGNFDVLRDVYGTEDVPLVFLQTVYPDVIRAYQGDMVSVLPTEGPVRKWLGPWLQDREHWPVGGNVGSFCLDLAIYMGADPIILVGQDFSFPLPASHSEGVVGRRKVPNPENDPHALWLDGVTGEKVLSNVTLAGYLEEFRQTIAKTDRVFVNTSPTGARIEGAVEMRLSEALKQWCRTDRPITGTIRRIWDREPIDGPAIVRELSNLSAELKELRVVAAKALEFNTDVVEMLDASERADAPKLQARLKVHEEYIQGLEKYCQVFFPLKACMAPAWARIFDTRGSDRQGPVEREDIPPLLNRGRLLAEAALEGAENLDLALARAQEELAGMTTFPGGPNPSLEDLVQKARAWARLGRLKKTWACFRDILSLAPDDDELWAEAARLCLERERPRAAMNLARSFLERKPDSRPMIEALSACQKVVADWEDRAENLLAEDDWIGALILSDRVLANDPDRPGAREVKERCLGLRAERIRAAEEKEARWEAELVRRRIMAQAFRAFEEARFSEVVELLSGRLEPYRPADHEGLVILGVALAELDRGEEGLAFLKQVWALRPDWPFLMARLGPVLVRHGFWDPGLDLMERAGRQDQGNRNLLFEAGCLAMKAGDHRRALADFEAFVRYCPASFETLNKMAVCHLALGRPDSARGFFEKTLAIKPDFEAARLGLEKCRCEIERPADQRKDKT